MRYSRLQVAQTMMDTGLVPVFYHADAEVAKAVVKACYDGGVRCFEFTNRGEFAHEVFAELRKYARAELPGMMLGIGSVIDAGTTALYLQLGASFVVSPVLNPDMAKVCNRRKVLWSPGCGSLTEISLAEELGAEIVKIFPGAQVGGPEFVQAILGPSPWTSVMPTGGVSPTEDSIRAWFEAGVVCVGMGSRLFPTADIAAGNYAAITDNVRAALALIQCYQPSRS